jgi:hypothetical protein
MTQLYAHVRLAVNGRAIFAAPLTGKTATPGIETKIW